MDIEAKSVTFQLDLGATCNVIRKQDLPSGVALQATNQVLSVYNESQVHPLGKCVVNMPNPKTKKKYKTQFVVVENAFSSLLGAQTIQQMGLVKICHENMMMVTTGTTVEQNKAKHTGDEQSDKSHKHRTTG